MGEEFIIEEKVKCKCGKRLKIKFGVRIMGLSPHGSSLRKVGKISVEEVKE